MSDNSKSSSQKSSLPETIRAVAPYMNIGWTFLGSLGLGLLGGYWADAWLGTEPWLFLLGAVLGIALGFCHFFATVLRQ